MKCPRYLYQALTVEEAEAAAIIICPFCRVALKILQEGMPVTQKIAEQTDQCQLLKALSSLAKKESQQQLSPQNKQNTQINLALVLYMHRSCTEQKLWKAYATRKNLKFFLYLNIPRGSIHVLYLACYFHLEIC